MSTASPKQPGSRGRGLSTWIAAALVLLVLAGTLVLLGLVERFARIHATRNAVGALQQVAWQLRDQLDRGMAYRYEELHILAGLNELRSDRSPERIQAVLETVQGSFPLYAWLGYVNADGTVEAATGGLLQGLDVSARPWFRAGLQGPFVGDVHKAVLLEKLLPRQDSPWRFVDIAMPIKDAAGATTHVLGAHLSWEWVRDLRRNLFAPAAEVHQAEVFVIDQEGRVLLGPEGSEEGQPLGLSGFVAKSAGESASMRAWDDGRMYATAVVHTAGHGRYPGLGWSVVVRQTEAAAFADYRRLRGDMILGGIAACLLAALCAPLLARRLTRPLFDLTRAVEARSKGERQSIPRLRDFREVDLLSQALAEAGDLEARHLDELEKINQGLEERIEARTAELREGRERLRAITDNIPALVADVDRELRFRFANRTYRDWFDVDPASLTGQPMSALYGEAAVHAWKPHLDRVLAGEQVQFERTMDVKGQRQHSSATYLPHRGPDGQVDGFHALVFDVTASKELELRLENEASHDALTGLPNRRHLLRVLPPALARADRQKQPVALLFLDLDGFKDVNDTHGHDAGDQLLDQVAARLKSVVRKGDTVARLAGDEFVILLEPVKQGLADAQLVARKIEAAIAQPFSLEEVVVRISVSTGIALYEPGSGRQAEELLAGADSAMYEAKRAARAARAAQ